MEEEKEREGNREGLKDLIGLSMGKERSGSIGSRASVSSVGSVESGGNRMSADWKRKWEETKEEIKGKGKKEKEEGERAAKKVQLTLDEYREGGGKVEREMKKFMAEMREDLMKIRKEMEEMKVEMKRREVNWSKEKREMKEKIESLEEEAKEKEKGGKEQGEKTKKSERDRDERMWEKKEDRMEERMKRIEKGIEREERERRKRNLIFKGVKEGKGEIRERIEKICLEIGVKTEIEEIKRIRTNKEERGQMVIVKIKSEEERRRILENKRKMKGKEIWIEEDLTFKERKMAWRIRKIMEEERGKGKVVRLGNRGGSRGLWIESKWWFWEEEEEKLREGEGFERRAQVEKKRVEEVREGEEGKE